MFPCVALVDAFLKCCIGVRVAEQDRNRKRGENHKELKRFGASPAKTRRRKGNIIQTWRLGGRNIREFLRSSNFVQAAKTFKISRGDRPVTPRFAIFAFFAVKEYFVRFAVRTHERFIAQARSHLDGTIAILFADNGYLRYD